MILHPQTCRANVFTRKEEQRRAQDQMFFRRISNVDGCRSASQKTASVGTFASPTRYRSHSNVSMAHWINASNLVVPTVTRASFESFPFIFESCVQLSRRSSKTQMDGSLPSVLNFVFENSIASGRWIPFEENGTLWICSFGWNGRTHGYWKRKVRMPFVMQMM